MELNTMTAIGVASDDKAASPASTTRIGIGTPSPLMSPQDNSSAAGQNGGQDTHTTHRETDQLDVNIQQETSGNSKNSQGHSAYFTVSDVDAANPVRAVNRSVSPTISEVTSLFTGGEPGPDVGPWKRISGCDTPLKFGATNMVPSTPRPVSPICVQEVVPSLPVYNGDLDNVTMPLSARLPPQSNANDNVSRDARYERMMTVPSQSQTGRTAVLNANPPSSSEPSAAPGCTLSEHVQRSQMKRRPAPLCIRKANSNQSLAEQNRLRSTSTRALAPPFHIDDRPIFVTNAMDYIIYDGPCDHCYVNGCPCRDPTLGLEPGFIVNWVGGNIITEGFCRHCVLLNCSCVRDPQWGQRHATAAKQSARFDSAPRVLTDTGAVQRYTTELVLAPESRAHVLVRQVAVRQPVPVSGSENARSTKSMSREDGNKNASPKNDDNSIAIDSAETDRDLEAQYDPHDDTHSVSIFRVPHSDQTGSHSPPEPSKRGFVANYYCRGFVVIALFICMAVAAVGIWLAARHGSTPY